MNRISFRPFPMRIRLAQLLTTSALALVLTALPVGIEAGAPVPHWQAAFAKSDGGGDKDKAKKAADGSSTSKASSSDGGGSGSTAKTAEKSA